MGGPDGSSLVILELVVAVVIVAVAVRYVRIPYTVALVLTGLALAVLPHMPYAPLTWAAAAPFPGACAAT